jgi:hypothetical protein
MDRQRLSNDETIRSLQDFLLDVDGDNRSCSDGSIFLHPALDDVTLPRK